MNELSGHPAPEARVSGREAGLRTQREPGSFRDRNGNVFYRDGAIFRSLSPEALANWQRLRKTPFLAGRMAGGSIVETRDGDVAVAPDAAGVLEHARIPFVSYPYEWTFGMLQDAALLHLDLMRDALASDMILKDATPYNIQWQGVHPVFIDIPSFEPLGRGQPWVGYRQFCELFLYPLMLQAYRGIDFRPWLRGRIDGIPAEDMQRLMSTRDLLRPGVLLHVAAQSALQRRYEGGTKDVRGSLAEAGFDKALIVNNVTKLRALVAKLTPGREKTQWSDYDRSHSYDAADFEQKAAFVRRAAATRDWRLAWDLGCNTGTFSRIVAEHAEQVVSMDADWMAIEHLYQREKAGAGSRKLLPLVVNLADASPNQGWRGAERKGLAERGRPELTLCLALVHHVVITANIPLADFIGWLASLGTAVVIEFVGRDDEMVQALLANREDQYDDYHPENFRALLAERFDIRAEEPLKGGRRQIYFAEPRQAAG
ncbi:MAG: class I SAM-dependent methyltransferase [Rhodobacteraceae bacterium]|nr:class I SAM-dependent methyltransferase [Paracoccaceae bacterium]